MSLDGVRALLFDVFGTLVDWRAGVAQEAARLLAPLGYSIDWIAFSDAWRGEYQPAMEAVRSGAIPFSKLDILHRQNLDRIRPRFGLDGLSEDQCTMLNTVWHRLPPWPDVPDGLTKLRARFLLAPVSNGNISMMVHLARHNDFRWDAILGAELAHDYKPKPDVYRSACAALDLAPEQCMMVAAHSFDLSAAAALGLRTAHVARPDEYGPGRGGEAAPMVPGDVTATDFIDLARQLGV
jgi:2-haloacid dehalogenase